MKPLAILSFLCFFCFACKPEKQESECVCADLEFYNPSDFGVQEGVIIFPTSTSKGIYKIKTNNNFTTYGTLHGICTDSVFIKQIENKQIKDSSQVILTGVTTYFRGYCDMSSQSTVIRVGEVDFPGPPIIRVKTIDKK
jgi:hypothetical protein